MPSGRSRGRFTTNSTFCVLVTDGNGEPVAWPVSLGGDKAYRANWIDENLLDPGIQPIIPPRETEDREKYKRHSIVENVIGWLKESRRVFSRFEKTTRNFGGFVKMAFIHRYLRMATRQEFSDMA